MNRFAAAALVAVLVSCLGVEAGAATPKDAYCPESAAKVDAFTALGAKSSDPEQVARAAEAAAEAYRGCALNALSVGNIEPAVNYDNTRVAQFEFAQARALALIGKTTEAVALYRDARAIAARVAAWTPQSMVYINSNRPGISDSALNRDRKPSSYQKSAEAIRDAADAALAKLGAGPDAPQSPSPSASTKPGR